MSGGYGGGGGGDDDSVESVLRSTVRTFENVHERVPRAMRGASREQLGGDGERDMKLPCP